MMHAIAIFLASALALQQAAANEHGGDWTYNMDWETIGECNSGKTGASQTPIDLNPDSTKSDVDAGGITMAPLKMNSPSDALSVEFVTNKHTWEVVMNPAASQVAAAVPSIDWGGKNYKLLQYHYHSPSENTVNGKHYDMEAHHVHKSDDGSLLVLAVFLEVGDGAPNDYLSGFWGDFPAQSGTPGQGSVTDPYINFVPLEKSYYYTMGSLTTPPCTNGLTWLIMKTPVHVSMEQRHSYRVGINAVDNNQLYIENPAPAGVEVPWKVELGNNDRPVQAVNGRPIYFYGSYTDTFDRWNLVWICVVLAVILASIVGAIMYMKKGKKKSSKKSKKSRDADVQDEQVALVMAQPQFQQTQYVQSIPQYAQPQVYTSTMAREQVLGQYAPPREPTMAPVVYR